MTIAQLLSELSSSQERIWAIIQYWSSVSFGLIIAMHVIQTQLKWTIVSALLIIYSAYSNFCLSYANQANIQAIGAYQQASALLAELQAQGEDLTMMREALEAGFSNAEFSLISVIVAAIGLFLITIAYTIYRQLTVRREAS